MPTDNLNEREFELVNIVGARLGANQRDLSRQMDMSLGMVNMLVRRMISKGYIRIKQLNKKKVEYLLTPKGFSEKMRKSVKYTIKTLSSIGLIRKRLRDLILNLYNKGERTFYVLGESDLVVLVEWTLNDLNLKECTYSRISQPPTNGAKGVVLICREESSKMGDKAIKNYVDLISELSKHQQEVTTSGRV